MGKLIFALIVVFCLTTHLQAGTEESNQISRIAKLLPDLDTPLAVEPYIPEDFVLMTQLHEPEQYFWGPKGLDLVYLASIDNLESITQPFIGVTKQDGFKSFKKDMDEMLSELKKQFTSDFKATFYAWGNYPVVSIQMMIGYDKAYIAYVGLNDKAGNVLFLILFTLLKKELDLGIAQAKKSFFFDEFFEED